MLEGLEYLHSHCKIIHTDIKPENILLCVTPQSSSHPPGDAIQTYTSAIKTTILQDPGKKCEWSKSLHWITVINVALSHHLLFQAEAAGKPGNLDNITVKIADLGSSCWVVRHIQSIHRMLSSKSKNAQRALVEAHESVTLLDVCTWLDYWTSFLVVIVQTLLSRDPDQTVSLSGGSPRLWIWSSGWHLECGLLGESIAVNSVQRKRAILQEHFFLSLAHDWIT